MLHTTKARGGIGDTPGLEDVQRARLNSSDIAIDTDISQPISRYTIGKNLLVLNILRRESRHG